jgi:hypothetical protein
MVRSKLTAKTLAATLSLSVALVGIPVRAETAQLSGSVYSSVDESPLSGVTVYAAEPETGQIFSSKPSSETGAFSIGDLPAGKFELGVAIDQGLYLIETPVSLAPAQSQHVNIAVNEKKSQASGSEVVPASAKPSVWSNPLTAALIVVGGAIIIGLLVNAATDDDPPGSPF